MRIAILGGGPQGCMLAYTLTKRGHKVTIYEKTNRLGGMCATEFYEGIPYEFGPQILYTNDMIDWEIFSGMCPGLRTKKYRVGCSVDGTLKDLHDFPFTMQNIYKWPTDIRNMMIEELNERSTGGNIRSVEDYLIQAVGPTIYSKYMKGYNEKQWNCSPKDILPLWVKDRPLTLAESPYMFGDQPQGHPGDYTSMWETMTKDAEVQFFSHIEMTNAGCWCNGTLIDTDLAISTLPLLAKHFYVPVTKIYIVAESVVPTTPFYNITFPNHFNFTRMFSYRQQYNCVSDYDLVDFAFPAVSEYDLQSVAEAANAYGILTGHVVSDYFVKSNDYAYPLNTELAEQTAGAKFTWLARNGIIPAGRGGLHSYISKAACMKIAWAITARVKDFKAMDTENRMKFFIQLRSIGG